MTDEQKKGAKTPIVNDNCIGCGACAAICGEVFDMDEESGKAFVKENIDFSNSECIEDAISACPVDAIGYID